MGTHPIFESDFDCLTEWRTGGVSPRPSCVICAAEATLEIPQVQILEKIRPKAESGQSKQNQKRNLNRHRPPLPQLTIPPCFQPKNQTRHHHQPQPAIKPSPNPITKNQNQFKRHRYCWMRVKLRKNKKLKLKI